LFGQSVHFIALANASVGVDIGGKWLEFFYVCPAKRRKRCALISKSWVGTADLLQMVARLTPRARCALAGSSLFRFGRKLNPGSSVLLLEFGSEGRSKVRG
jgi:hypothetical protein